MSLTPLEQKVLKLNWDLLKRFHICANSKSFKEAAEVIGTSISAIVKQMKELEQALQEDLFIKKGENKRVFIDLTSNGSELLNYTNKIYENILSGVDKKSEYDNTLKVFSTHEFTKVYLTKYLSPFIRHNLQLKYQISLSLSPREIQDNEVAIRTSLIQQNDTVIKPFMKISMKLFAHKQYLEKNGIPKEVTDLKNHQILSHNESWRDITALSLHPIRGTTITPFIEIDSAGSLHELAIQKLGIVSLPDVYPIDTDLVPILPNLKSVEHQIYYSYKRSSLNNKSFSDLIYYIEENLPQ